MEFWKIKLIRNNFGITMPSEILRVSIFLSYLGKFYVARNLLFSKVTKKFSWTYTLEFWAENFSQYSPLKVEEHKVPSEIRSDAWFMRKLLVSIFKKSHCMCDTSKLPIFPSIGKSDPIKTKKRKIGKWIWYTSNMVSPPLFILTFIQTNSN